MVLINYLEQARKKINTLRIKADSVVIPENIDIAAQKYFYSSPVIRTGETFRIIRENIQEVDRPVRSASPQQ